MSECYIKSLDKEIVEGEVRQSTSPSQIVPIVERILGSLEVLAERKVLRNKQRH